MAEIVPLKRNGTHEEPPYLSGDAVCLACGAKHVSCHPVGVHVFECPACHAHKAVMSGFVNVPEGHARWVCQCGCDLFRIDERVTFCANCGERQVF